MFRRLSKLLLKKGFKTLIDISMVLFGGYLALQKLGGFSISAWLESNNWPSDTVILVVDVLSWLIVFILTCKIFILYFERHPVVKFSTKKYEDFTDCLSQHNRTALKDVMNVNRGRKVIYEPSDMEEFEVTTGLIVKQLSSSLRNRVLPAFDERKDVFISLYTFDDSLSSLIYELHYHPGREIVSTQKIPIKGSECEEYECVKCMRSNEVTCYLVNKNHYKKGNPGRYKSLKHYMGCKLRVNGGTVGFLNIEFHNHKIFSDQSEMEDLMEINVYPFKMMLEAQYLRIGLHKLHVKAKRAGGI